MSSKVQKKITENAEQTRALGESLAGRLRAGDLVTLQGELGAGKTTCVQGLARGLGVSDDATSPTFMLIVEHEGKLPVLHIDAYRLVNRGDEPVCYDALRDSGILDALDREDAIKIVEWPERIWDVLPVARFALRLQSGSAENQREVEIVENVNEDGDKR